jgi:hypothetical protein
VKKTRRCLLRIISRKKVIGRLFTSGEKPFMFKTTENRIRTFYKPTQKKRFWFKIAAEATFKPEVY